MLWKDGGLRGGLRPAVNVTTITVHSVCSGHLVARLSCKESGLRRPQPGLPVMQSCAALHFRVSGTDSRLVTVRLLGTDCGSRRSSVKNRKLIHEGERPCLTSVDEIVVYFSFKFHHRINAADEIFDKCFHL